MVKNKHVNRRANFCVDLSPPCQFLKISENVEAIFGFCDGARGGQLFTGGVGPSPAARKNVYE